MREQDKWKGISVAVVTALGVTACGTPTPKSSIEMGPPGRAAAESTETPTPQVFDTPKTYVTANPIIEATLDSPQPADTPVAAVTPNVLVEIGEVRTGVGGVLKPEVEVVGREFITFPIVYDGETLVLTETLKEAIQTNANKNLRDMSSGRIPPDNITTLYAVDSVTEQSFIELSNGFPENQKIGRMGIDRTYYSNTVRGVSGQPEDKLLASPEGSSEWFWAQTAILPDSGGRLARRTVWTRKSQGRDTQYDQYWDKETNRWLPISVIEKEISPGGMMTWTVTVTEPKSTEPAPTETPTPAPTKVATELKFERDWSTLTQKELKEVYDQAQKIYTSGNDGVAGKEYPMDIDKKPSLYQRFSAHGILLEPAQEWTVNVMTRNGKNEPIGVYVAPVMFLVTNSGQDKSFVAVNVVFGPTGIANDKMGRCPLSGHEKSASQSCNQVPVGDVVENLAPMTQHIFGLATSTAGVESAFFGATGNRLVRLTQEKALVDAYGGLFERLLDGKLPEEHRPKDQLYGLVVQMQVNSE